MKFGDDAKTKSYDFSLVQYIKMNNYADANWAASLPNRLQLKKEFENITSTTNLSISLAYTFDRSNPNAPSASNEVVQPLKIPGMDNVLRGFTKIFSLDCEKDKNQSSFLFIPPFFTGVHYLNDKETALPDSSKSLKWMKGLRVFYSCENYWKVDQYFNCTIDSKDDSVCPEDRIPGQNMTGVSFFTFSTKIAPSYFKFSIITFYVSIVLVIGKLFRNVCIIPANRIFIWEIPNSEKLLLLCECIYIYRMRSQLDQEEQLYFTFADIMRSPEMIKAITGSSMKKKSQ